MKIRDIKKYLFLDRVDYQELLNVILSYFGHAESIDQYTYKFIKKNTGSSLILKIDEEGKITDILNSSLSQSGLVEVGTVIENALVKNQNEAIGQSIGFSFEKVEGVFKYKNLFQIVPVQEHAPKAGVAIADHPFIIQSAYKSSANMMVDNQRRLQKANTYVRLLNALLNTRLTLGSRYARFTWVLNTETPNKKWTSEWKQEMYTYDGFSGKINSFSDTNNLEKIRRVDSSKYYVKFFGRTGDPLILPDNIEESLDSIFGLSASNLKRFFMSSAWIDQAQTVWNDSCSLSFVAYVNAIESLIEKPKNPERCPRCKKELEGPTMRFKNFLKKHVPFIDQFESELKLIYNVRSTINHGLDLLERDLYPWRFTMSKKTESQDTLYRNLHYIVITAVRNWLWSQKGS